MTAEFDRFVSGDELLLAMRNWNKVMNEYEATPYSFSTFIGPHLLIPNFNSYGWGWKVSELAYNKIRMLASPHHYALLKAFKARTGWQGKIPM